ncbi:hypothetical protein D5086_000307 [Populus alba]|uniref:Uncharacterized protein n=1 Tax=Populus alba TaxID=43335 RepID=A0ACC4CVG9_POPAL
MEVFEVAKDKLGLDSKRYTTLLFVCSVALPVSLMILIMYQNQLLHLTGGLAKAEKSRNVAALNVGNRMLSMAATFLYALLTNRVLLVNHKTDMANLFCEPFLNTSWLLPEDFPLGNHFGRSKHRYAHSFGSMLNKSITNTSMEPPEPYLDLNLALGGYDQLAFCLKPWIWRMGSKNPACQRAISMEPCCHFPLSYDCKTRVEVKAATLVANTMHCEDRKNGLKLV